MSCQLPQVIHESHPHGLFQREKADNGFVLATDISRYQAWFTTASELLTQKVSGHTSRCAAIRQAEWTLCFSDYPEEYRREAKCVKSLAIARIHTVAVSETTTKSSSMSPI